MVGTVPVQTCLMMPYTFGGVQYPKTSHVGVRLAQGPCTLMHTRLTITPARVAPGYVSVWVSAEYRIPTRAA